MKSKAIWNLIVIMGIVGLMVLSFYPPSEKVKLGLDLAGGTSLLYEVDMTNVEPHLREERLKSTISVLSNRVDPDGLFNLIWRIQGTNRIEVQMPKASEDASKRLAEYEKQLDAFEKTNITRFEIENGLKAAAPAALEALVRGVEGRKGLLEAALKNHQAVAAAEKALAEAQMKNLPSEEKLKAVKARLDAREAYDKSIAAVEATNIPRTQLVALMSMSTKQEWEKETKSFKVGSSSREQALQSLILKHPERKGALENLVLLRDRYFLNRQGLDDANDLKRLLRGAGVLEFRIAARETDPIPDLDKALKALKEQGPRAAAINGFGWFVIDKPDEFAHDRADRELLTSSPRGFFSLRNMIGDEYGGDYYVLLWDTPEKALSSKFHKDWKLDRASPTRDELNFPAVQFNLDVVGGKLMGELTGKNIKREMAIVLDGRVYSAPRINSQIHDRGIISGGSSGFSSRELDYLVRTLSAGELGTKLIHPPVSELYLGPSLGADNLKKGLESGYWAALLVLSFMAAYYFFCGMVANFALAVNIIILVGLLAGLQTAFTLPGIAGVILTIGMAVDANVLIYERVREELERNEPVEVALRLGYEKAFSSIIDGNLTNLIVCVVLYYTAMADIKGFAVTLGVGIFATLFTALFVTKTIFHLWDAFFGLRKIRMLPMVSPAVKRLFTLNVDWASKLPLYMLISGTLIAVSIIGMIDRGREMLSIEFRAGTEVVMQLNEKQGSRKLTLAEVRERLKGVTETLPNAAPVAIGSADDKGGYGSFKIVTTQADQKIVTETVIKLFKDVLDVPPTISFQGQGKALADSRMFVKPITKPDLSGMLADTDLKGEPVNLSLRDRMGGALMLLQGIEPPQTAAELSRRISDMTHQPDYDKRPHRTVEVTGIKQTGIVDGQPVFSAAAVTVTDEGINYFDNAARWEADLADMEWSLVSKAMERTSSLSKVSNFSAAVAESIAFNALAAMFLSVVAIIAYVWFRFGNLSWGLAAIVALVHDVMITLGAVVLSEYVAETWFGNALMLESFQVDMAMVAALLTIVGYSLNDTIVVFDRIRENRGRLNYVNKAIINNSINQTMSRTLLTGTTTFCAVILMYVIGGDGIRGFAFALIVGLLIGTYSSVAIAAPILLLKKGCGPAGDSDGAPVPAPVEPTPSLGASATP